jgi:hypothetical protein
VKGNIFDDINDGVDLFGAGFDFTHSAGRCA